MLNPSESLVQVSEEGMAPPLRQLSSEDGADRLEAALAVDRSSRSCIFVMLCCIMIILAWTEERLILTAPVGLRQLLDAVPLLEAEIPLLESGKALFNRLPSAWLDVTGNNTAMGHLFRKSCAALRCCYAGRKTDSPYVPRTRCLFASRRHELSVFEPLKSELMLQAA